MSGGHLSYSQLNSWRTCGARFFYERVQKLPSRPSWAQAGGSVVHRLTELWDLAQFSVDGVTLSPLPSFEEALDEEANDLAERTGFSPEEFKATGRASKEWPDKEDRKWWLHHGPVFVQKWQQWRESTTWDIYVGDDGRPMVETEINVPIGDELVKLFIDRVFITPEGELAVVDLKAGQKTPFSGDQLGLYAFALGEMLLTPFAPQWGYYWMARTGGTSAPFDLTQYDQQRLRYEYGALAHSKEQGIYLPNPGPLCGSCGVREFCPTMGGEKAAEVTQPWGRQKEAS